ncbi:MAG: DNA-3-methyladenine glycosylase [Ponticaulis sp.]|nr:DNA-3-methyladenine glycosylase [Ponticaulis sp.]|tara:strand:- start:26222 stop:26854 length:633 start_codon:yes stop_codon:yes gene_type:complete
MLELTPETLKRACEDLSARDPALAQAYSTIGVPAWRSVPLTYQSLARIIVYQQISTRAAASIWERLLNWSSHDLLASAVMNATETDLRGCGLSGPKVRHLKSIAEAVESGTLPLKALTDMEDENARNRLLSVKGIGPWTADVFLMGALHRMDVFPVADVGLMEALRLLKDADTRLSAKEFAAQSEAWRPWRGMAAHLLWGYLNHLRDTTP